ncbi:hypothetical protein [Pararhizobium sp. IMCC21322]|uniref:hypothetical protein n=1 Tax=Pararhizobium sp. IMCC21322 TaxID=3067903 RepID=UPI002740B4F6|nr:hypothetical protein [Pararhizobium sp. IMCC21322]
MHFCQRNIWSVLVGLLVVGIVFSPVAALGQDIDLERITEISRPGQTSTNTLQSGLARLSVARSGLYRISISDQGSISLYSFPSAEDQANSKAAPKLLRSSATSLAGDQLDDLLLERERPYLLQVKSDNPQSISFELIMPLDEIPEFDDPDKSSLSTLKPGQLFRFRPQKTIEMKLQAETTDRLLVEAIREPGLKLAARLGSWHIASGGVFPLHLEREILLRLDAVKRADQSFAPIIVRVLEASDTQETEPNSEREGGTPGNLGKVDDDGFTASGNLLAKQDRDAVEFLLEKTSFWDLSLNTDRDEKVELVFERLNPEPAAEILKLNTWSGQALRRGLELPAGTYRVTINGSPDHPLGYELRFDPATQPTPAAGREPDDTEMFARELPVDSAVRGALSDDDPDMLRFDVDADGHLWELRGIVGIKDITLSDGNQQQIGRWKADDKSLVLLLSLHPGQYFAKLQGNGPYAFRLTDLGPVPDGDATEPNDTQAEALRIRPGDRFEGNFHTNQDLDLFSFDLEVDTPLTLIVTPPDDGAVNAELKRDNRRWAAATISGAENYSARLPAGQWTLRLSPAGNDISGRYEVSLARADGAEGPEPDTLPGTLQALPTDGLIKGRVGAFDDLDLVFVPLPEGTGQLALTCSGDGRDISLWTYGDKVRLAAIDTGRMILTEYGPDLGGAIELRIGRSQTSFDYQCQVAFIQTDNDPLQAKSATHGDATPPQLLNADTRLDGQFDDEKDEDSFTIEADGLLAGFSCSFLPRDKEPYRPKRGREISAEGSPSLSRSLEQDMEMTGWHLFQPDNTPQIIKLKPPRNAEYPMPWACRTAGPSNILAPAQMGPPAAFTAPRDRRPADTSTSVIVTDYDPNQALQVLSGGRPEWLRAQQVVEDLPVSLSVKGLETPFRAFSKFGQRAELTATVRNDSALPVELSIALSALAEGWRVTPSTTASSVDPGQELDLSIVLEMPLMQSSLADPALYISAKSSKGEAAATFPVSFETTTPERGAHLYWLAPAQLRGGLDPMSHQFGAQLIGLDGATASEDDAKRYSFLHDGAAYHASLPTSVKARELTFQLASSAPVAGYKIQLRSTEPRSNWPRRIALDLSANGADWTQVATQQLDARLEPQIFSLSEPFVATHARWRLNDCQGDADCKTFALSDIGLIADPAWRPDNALNIAATELGGHIIAAGTIGNTVSDETLFSGSRNVGILTQGKSDRLTPQSTSAGKSAWAVIGFQGNRAARIDAIDWVGRDDDGPRIPTVGLEISQSGPAGPWLSIGSISAPPIGDTNTRLELPAPVWARALRLSFERDEKMQLTLPDQIAVFEDRATKSVLGLWEDDRPDAVYEDQGAASVPVLPTPAGGANAAEAVDLKEGPTIVSSVQIERNEDWWRIAVPEGMHRLTFRFPGISQPEMAWRLTGPDGADIPLLRAASTTNDLNLSASVGPGEHLLTIFEPPRSIVILWDTSGSVAQYIPRTLAAVRLWAQSLIPGRDVIQLLPFGSDKLLLDDWAENPEDVYQALANLPSTGSSGAEQALATASIALAGPPGINGIVVITDAETSQFTKAWAPLLSTRPRVVALSIDSSDATSVQLMKDWASINKGYFHRVIGQSGLADGMELAAALFRAPKAYKMAIDLSKLVEPTGEGQLFISEQSTDGSSSAPSGAIELILDASGSMLKRMPDGQRRIAVAHNALAEVVNSSLPSGMPFAYRAFGLAADACQSDLLLPFGPLDPAVAEAAIRNTPAINLAKTAIAQSLVLAAEDLASLNPPRVVVLVTDGDETCDGDVAGEINRIAESGIDLRLTIVGFAIDDEALAKTFSDWADAGDGRYISADDPDALIDAIAEAVAPRFELTRLYLDGGRESIGIIGLNEARTLPAGRYRLRPMQTALGPERDIEVIDEQSSEIVYSPETGLTLP